MEDQPVTPLESDAPLAADSPADVPGPASADAPTNAPAAGDPTGTDLGAAPIAAPPGKPARNSTKTVIEWVVLIASALVIAVLVKTFLFQAFYIPSDSMVPTLKTNDRVIVNKLSYKLHSVHRGDIVVFKTPKGPDGKPIDPDDQGSREAGDRPPGRDGERGRRSRRTSTASRSTSRTCPRARSATARRSRRSASRPDRSQRIITG